MIQYILNAHKDLKESLNIDQLLVTSYSFETGTLPFSSFSSSNSVFVKYRRLFFL